jgi:Endonuclease/Exonuclease/phosphatase family
MASMIRRGAAFASAAALALAAAAPALAHGDRDRELRFATFNASVNRNVDGQLVEELSNGDDPQLRNVAEIIQRVRPHVLLINEFDFVPDQRAARLFQRNYLSVPHNGARPIQFRYRFVAPSNTGIASGHDLDNNGQIVTQPGSLLYGNDSFGFGEFPGKFGMAVYSRLPIDSKRARTFQLFRWKDMPGALLPDDPNTPAPRDWYSPAELDVFRLSSKSHWDLPIELGRGKRVHFLVSHPTPPVFDGPEDRNGTRNHDEIRFWADYVNPEASGYIYDDEGRRGGLRRGEHFVIAGDQNADPFDGDSVDDAILQLLDHPRVNTSVTPTSPGGPEQSRLQGQANASHVGNPAFDTADFADGAPGNLRADYVLPDRGIRIREAFVFWPLTSDPLFRLVGTFTPGVPDGNGFPSSDHRLVAVDLEVPGRGGRDDGDDDDHDDRDEDD